MKQATASARQGIATKDASERSEASHANGASRRSGSRESVWGSPRGEAPRIDQMSRASRMGLVVAALLPMLAFAGSLWRIQLEAPQYPEGIGLSIWINTIAGP